MCLIGHLESLALCLDRPRPRTRRCDVQEDEAEQDGGVAHVDARIHRPWRVGHPVADRHFAREKKRDRAGEEADEDECAADEFDQAGYPHEAERRDRTRRHRREAGEGE